MSNILKKGVSALLCVLMAGACLLVLPVQTAEAAIVADTVVNALVVQDYATVYASASTSARTLGELSWGSEVTGYLVNSNWLKFSAEVNGVRQDCYIRTSALVEYGDDWITGEGNDYEWEDQDIRDLDEPNDWYHREGGGKLKDGEYSSIERQYMVRSTKITVRAKPNLNAKVLCEFAIGAKFDAVLRADGVWLRTKVWINGRNVYGYILREGEKKTTRNPDTVRIRISKEGVKVYSSASTKSSLLGAIHGPTRLEGKMSSDGKWIIASLNVKGERKTGYIWAANSSVTFE